MARIDGAWVERSTSGFNGTFLRRLPVILLLRFKLSNLLSFNDALYLGWFGPIAVVAIYYSSLMEQKLRLPFVWEVVSLAIFSSAIAYGLVKLR